MKNIIVLTLSFFIAVLSIPSKCLDSSSYDQDAIVQDSSSRIVIEGSWQYNQKKTNKKKESPAKDNSCQPEHEKITEQPKKWSTQLVNAQQPTLERPEKTDLKELIDENPYKPITIVRANLFKADLSGTVWYQDSSMTYVYAKEINVENAILGPNISWQNLNVENSRSRKLNFTGEMLYVSGDHSDYSDAFICGTVRNSHFKEADFTNAKLAGDFINVDFTGAKTDNLSFCPKTNLAKTTGLSLTIEQIVEAKKNNCILPWQLEIKWYMISTAMKTTKNAPRIYQKLSEETKKYIELIRQKIS